MKKSHFQVEGHAQLWLSAGSALPQHTKNFSGKLSARLKKGRANNATAATTQAVSFADTPFVRGAGFPAA